MRIYLAGAINQASSELFKFYEKFAEELRAFGYTVYVPHQGTAKFDLNDNNIDSDIFAHDVSELMKCNLVISYIGLASTGTGAELSMAIQTHKEIFAYYSDTDRPSFFITGMLKAYDNLVMIKGKDLQECKDLILKAI